MRTHYKNGDELSLQHTGCDGCSPSMVNGRICHEQGCPDAWRDQERKCKWCGSKFHPVDREQLCCGEECVQSYCN